MPTLIARSAKSTLPITRAALWEHLEKKARLQQASDTVSDVSDSDEDKGS